MSNLNELKSRLSAAKQTRQITNAMYLLSTSLMKKAMQNIDFNLYYMKRLRGTMKDILSKTKHNDIDNRFIKEQGEGIVFLRKIVRGGADRSYGIQVARLAGVPEVVLGRADELAGMLSANDLNNKTRSVLESNTREKKEEEMSGAVSQISIFDFMNKTDGFDDIILEIHDMDLNGISPIDALNLLYGYQRKMKEKF